MEKPAKKSFKITFRKHKHERWSFNYSDQWDISVNGEEVGSVSCNTKEGKDVFFFSIRWEPKFGLLRLASSQAFSTGDEAKEAAKAYLRANIKTNMKCFEMVVEVVQKYKVSEWAEDEVGAMTKAKKGLEYAIAQGRLNWQKEAEKPEVGRITVKEE